MYRYSVNSEITYTPEDLVLFRESPFATWMERLTLENPGHGAVPDSHRLMDHRVESHCGSAAGCGSQPLNWEAFVGGLAASSVTVEKVQVDFAKQLTAKGKNVESIARYTTEVDRRSATLDAMRSGVEYIADAQLALGPLSCRADMLIRTEGVSELGGHFYLPLDTAGSAGRHTIHHLCFAADLLESIQGVLPFQLLDLSLGADISCLSTRDHIKRFRDLKYDFMSAQLSFRKHRMPDPALSSHFGRWSNCAREVLSARGRGLARGTAVPKFTAAPQQYMNQLHDDVASPKDTANSSRAPNARRGLVAALNKAVAVSARIPPNTRREFGNTVPCLAEVAISAKAQPSNSMTARDLPG